MYQGQELDALHISPESLFHTGILYSATYKSVHSCFVQLIFWTNHISCITISYLWVLC
jgi:hypothetical protein